MGDRSADEEIHSLWRCLTALNQTIAVFWFSLTCQPLDFFPCRLWKRPRNGTEWPHEPFSRLLQRHPPHKHAPAATRKVTNTVSSPWFSLVSVEFLEAKTNRRQAERKWRASGLLIRKQPYKKAKHYVTKTVMKAKSAFFNCKISAASSSKELYNITNTLLAKTKLTHLPTCFPLPDFPELFSNFFLEKII